MIIKNIHDLKSILNLELIKNINFKRSPKLKSNSILLRQIFDLYKLSYSEIKYLLDNKNELEKLHIFCPVCGKKNTYFKNNYLHHCSIKCAARDPERRNKIRQKRLNDIDEGGLNSYQRMVLKVKETKMKNHNDPNFVNPQKAKRTSFKKRGVEHHMKLESYKQQKRDLWDDEEWAAKNIKHNQISKLFNHNNSGWNNPEKSKRTNLLRRGVEHHTKTQEYKNRFKDKNYKDAVVQHRYNTMKMNGTYGSSNAEDMIHQFLLYKFEFEDIVPQYKDIQRYNFACDFYIKSLDLFIEINFYWTHGYEPFNYNNIKHLKLLKNWIEESNNINFKNERKNQYKKAMYIWTIDDVNKFKTAKQNNLNYLTFYNLEQFLDWLCPLIDTPDQ